VRYVIDAGVVVKWFIPEVDSAIAHELLERYLYGVDTPVAPEGLVCRGAPSQRAWGRRDGTLSFTSRQAGLSAWPRSLWRGSPRFRLQPRAASSVAGQHSCQGQRPDWGVLVPGYAQSA
jgi:hypothetical protein